MPRIPVATPDLSGNEERYVVDAIRSSWISSTGVYLERFEKEFAELCGTRAAVAVANGTVAMHLGLIAHGVGPGDEVIVPSLTYIATANAVRYTAAEPVFVDVDPDTWCIDPRLIEAAITPRTKGIVAVHLYGHPADMDAINKLADQHGLWVLEDAAEAHGAKYKGRTTGSLASAAAFSFYGNKIMTSGEGGALTVDDPELERRIRLYKGQGVDPNRRYYFPVVGFNYRLTNIAAAILCAQLERLSAIVADRRRIFATYRDGLSGIAGIGFQPVAPWADPAPWLFSVTIDEELYGHSRDQLMTILAASEIETRPFFIPIHSLPPYIDRSRERGEVLPITDDLARTGVNLPTYGGLLESDIHRVIACIRAGQAKRPVR